VDRVIEVGVDEEGDDVSGEGEVIFGEGWESIFDGFEETRDVGEVRVIVFVGYGGHLQRMACSLGE
jgi:hypothetical protein